jgi:ankyrin repeat protein
MNGRNPIHFAADYGQREVIDYLINQGADMNVRLFLHYIYNVEQLKCCRSKCFHLCLLCMCLFVREVNNYQSNKNINYKVHLQSNIYKHL